jgi:formate hydrogenlyase subunit 6/NADH:ubiquinone oxidoreductase subunit I
VAIDERDVQRSEEVRGTGLGLVKGLAVTLKHALRPSITQQYPEEKPDLPPRTRGVIALKEANCTVCYKCSRECPDWCIYIDAHKETHDPASGGKARSAKILDRFAIDYALCMYCGICVEVCPFDALFWSPEFEYSTYGIDELIHEKEKLEEWTYEVLPPPFPEAGAEPQEVGAVAAAGAGSPGSGSAAASAGPGVRTASQSPSAPAPAAPVAAAADAPAGVAAASQAAASEPTPEQATPSVAAAGEHAVAPTTPGPNEERVEAEPTEAASAAAAVAAHVEPDQETFERVLAEQLAQGKDRRVAEGSAKRAAIIAARQKAGA